MSSGIKASIKVKGLVMHYIGYYMASNGIKRNL